jgi:sulfur carrier protein ThiS
VTIYLRSGGKLRDFLKPDVDEYTRSVEVDGDQTLKEILAQLGVPLAFVAFAFTGGRFQRLDYRPSDGETITLQPPVSGG